MNPEKRKKKQYFKKALADDLNQYVEVNFLGMDSDSHQKGTVLKDNQTNNSPKIPRKWNEKHGMSHNLQFPLLAEYRKEILQWQTKTVKLPNVEEVNHHVSSTSFAYVVKELSKCIEGCLADSLSHSRNKISLPQLLTDYKVVQSLPDGKNLISLHKVHLILQDNFSDSWFCKFLNIMLSESIEGTISNSIDV